MTEHAHSPLPHSPPMLLPMQIILLGGARVFLGSADGQGVAEMVGSDAKDRAFYIVHCVNAHDALVEACQKSVALIELKYPATVAEAVSRWVVGDEVRGDVATTYMALRAALDAAKGGKPHA